MTVTLTFRAGEGRHEANGTVISLGDDILAWLVGGTRHHVGAVGVADARPSLADPRRVSHAPSLLTLPGHNEDRLVLEGAGRLSQACGRTVVLVAGLHVDAATPEDIDRLAQDAQEVLDRTACSLSFFGSSP